MSTKAYPVSFRTYPNGQVGAFFADVPEAITCGRDQMQALDLAQDALVVALSGYADDGRPFPRASRPRRGQHVIVLPPRVAIKLAVVSAMREQGVTHAWMAERLGVDGRQVRRILDLDHESRLAQLDAALAVLGLRAEISVSKVSPTDSRAAGTRVRS